MTDAGQVTFRAVIDTSGMKKGADEAKSKLSDLGKDGSSKLDMIGKKAATIGQPMSILSAGIVAAGGACLVAFGNVDEGCDNLIKATGATGDAAKELEAVYHDVAGNVKGDFADLGSMIGEVNTRFGFTGEELQGCSEQFARFSEITGADATEAVKKVARYMGDAGIESEKYGEVLDDLAVAAQASGISVDSLSEMCVQFGAPMRALGFDTKESIAIFSSWEKAGVNTSTAFSGMKKAISSWAADGKDAREEFKKTLQEIEACPDIASATTKAIEVFGAKAGPDLADAIKGGRFEYEEMLAVIEGSAGTVTNTYDEIMDSDEKAAIAMKNLSIVAADLGATLMEALAPVIEAVSEALKAFRNWFEELPGPVKTAIVVIGGVVAAIGPVLMVVSTVISMLPMLSAGFTAVAGAVKAFSAAVAANPIGLIITAIAALIAILVYLWDTNEDFRNAVINAWESVKTAAKNIFTAVKDSIIKPVSDALRRVGEFVQQIKKFLQFSGIANAVKAIFDKVGKFMSDPIGTAKKAISDAIDRIKGFLTGSFDFPHIKIPHFEIHGGKIPWGIGGKGEAPSVDIKYYARGGIMTDPTLIGYRDGVASVGGEAGPEAIMPLQGRYMQPFADAVADGIGLDALIAEVRALRESIPGAIAANAPDTLSINRREFARLVKESM